MRFREGGRARGSGEVVGGRESADVDAVIVYRHKRRSVISVWTLWCALRHALGYGG